MDKFAALNKIYRSQAQTRSRLYVTQAGNLIYQHSDKTKRTYITGIADTEYYDGYHGIQLNKLQTETGTL